MGMLMKKYNDILRELREDNDYSQETIAAELKITRQQYQLYESGKRKFKVEQIIQLCKFYNVSADYVFGLPENMPYPKRWYFIII